MNKYGFDIISVSIHGIIDCCYTVGLKKYGISDFVVFEKDEDWLFKSILDDNNSMFINEYELNVSEYKFSEEAMKNVIPEFSNPYGVRQMVWSDDNGYFPPDEECDKYCMLTQSLIMTSESSTDVNYDDLLKYITLIKRFSEKEIIQ